MTRQFVIVKADVSVDWTGADPDYRVYVNNELFAERTWVWREQYLEEFLQIWAGPGKYELRWELVPPACGTIEVKNVRIAEGPLNSRIVKNSLLRIENESI
jgi:hypothetical protein